MDYKITNLNPETVLLFKNCFDLNGSPKDLKKIEWQFFLNPEKKNYVNIAYDTIQERTAAIYAISPIRFLVNNEEVIASQSLDTITDVEYRGKGLFVSLAKDVYSTAAADGISLVYGFPNGNSIHGFQKKLEWVVLDPLPFLIRPLRTQYFTEKIKKLNFFPNVNLPLLSFMTNYNIVEDLRIPDEINNIWRMFSKKIKVGVIRDKEYLTWRYLNKPGENYRIAHCYNKTGKYLGLIIYTVKNKHEGRIGYIMELLCDINEKKIADNLVRYAMKQMKKDNADCVLAWSLNHSPIHHAFRRNLFFNLP